MELTRFDGDLPRHAQSYRSFNVRLLNGANVFWLSWQSTTSLLARDSPQSPAATARSHPSGRGQRFAGAHLPHAVQFMALYGGPLEGGDSAEKLLDIPF